jgi:hypothetical protein
MLVLKQFIFGFAMVIATSSVCLGQELLDRLNKLPLTVLRRAPEFDVNTKYVFSVDSVHDLLVIQDVRRHPDTRQIHFDQMIYEIPLDDLSAGSFRAAYDPDDKKFYNFTIGTTDNKPTIIQYFLRDDQVVAILSQDILSLGSWNYTGELENELKEIVQLLVSAVPDKSYRTKLMGMANIFHKFNTARATAIGLRDSVKTLNGEYYYGPALKSPPYYGGAQNIDVSNAKLIRDLKKESKALGLVSESPSPVFVYVADDGKITSIYFPNLSTSGVAHPDVTKFRSFTPGSDGAANVKSKFLFVLN